MSDEIETADEYLKRLVSRYVRQLEEVWQRAEVYVNRRDQESLDRLRVAMTNVEAPPEPLTKERKP